jgi:hypothetical protein
MILTFIIGNVNIGSRHFHNDSANWSPTTAASRQGQMHEANVAIPFLYTHQDGASTSGSVHQVGTSTSGSVQWSHQNAGGNGQWGHQNAGGNEPWRHQDADGIESWRHQDAGGNGHWRHQDASENGPWTHQDVAQIGGSVSSRTASDRKGETRSDRFTARSSSLGSGPPLVHEDSGIRGLVLPAPEELSRRELPPLYSVE